MRPKPLLCSRFQVIPASADLAAAVSHPAAARPGPAATWAAGSTAPGFDAVALSVAVALLLSVLSLSVAYAAAVVDSPGSASDVAAVACVVCASWCFILTVGGARVVAVAASPAVLLLLHL